MSVDVRHDDWRAANADWLALALGRLRQRLLRRALRLEQASRDGARDWEWASSPADDATERRFAGSSAARELDASLADTERRLAERERDMRDASRPPALRRLAEVAGLSPFEEELLLLAAAPALDAAFAAAYAELHADARRPFATLALALTLRPAAWSERIVLADALMPERSLRAFRLVEVIGADSEPALTRRLAVDERVVDYLRGVNRADSRVLPLLADLRAAPTPPTWRDLAEQVAATAATERWLTLNLVGDDRSGLREVAAAACARLGLRPVALDAGRLAIADQRELLLGLLGREALLGSLAYVVEASDEAATLVGELVARLAAPLFVLSRDRWPGGLMDVIRIKPASAPERLALWRSALAPYRHSLNGELDAIARHFDFGPSAIAEAVARASQAGEGSITARDLWRGCREAGATPLEDLARRIQPCYAWEDIVVPDDVRAQLRELADQVAMRGRVYDDWGFGEQLGRGAGITALFAGPSGVGKTMAAEILAAHLQLDLYRVDLAGVVSKYIGETEKNLRRVFDAAERSGVILFFDEADALFGTRTEVRDSHDRYANVEINYLLQRMEEYAGLAILATNRRTALDAAFLRRLRFVVEFPFPSVEDRRRIWERVFPSRTELDAVDLSALARLEVTGGSIRSIAVNGAFLAAAESKPLGMPHLLRAAAREYVKLSKPITASEFGPFAAAVRR